MLGSMTDVEGTRAARLRRQAQRLGLRLTRSRSRRPDAPDFGTYGLTVLKTGIAYASGTGTAHGLSLDDVERALEMRQMQEAEAALRREIGTLLQTTAYMPDGRPVVLGRASLDDLYELLDYVRDTLRRVDRACDVLWWAQMQRTEEGRVPVHLALADFSEEELLASADDGRGKEVGPRL
jgi:hypothetical protein